MTANDTAAITAAMTAAIARLFACSPEDAEGIGAPSETPEGPYAAQIYGPDGKPAKTIKKAAAAAARLGVRLWPDTTAESDPKEGIWLVGLSRDDDAMLQKDGSLELDDDEATVFVELP